MIECSRAPLVDLEHETFAVELMDDRILAADASKKRVALLREEAPRFTGTRFNAFLRLRAEPLGRQLERGLRDRLTAALPDRLRRSLTRILV
mgnify:CR=1 FL=1